MLNRTQFSSFCAEWRKRKRLEAALFREVEAVMKKLVEAEAVKRKSMKAEAVKAYIPEEWGSSKEGKNHILLYYLHLLT